MLIHSRIKSKRNAFVKLNSLFTFGTLKINKMKIKLLPILSIAAALFFSSSLSAQRNIDWSVDAINVPPTQITSKVDLTGSDITVEFVCKNLGPDTARAGDSIFYRITIPLSQTQAILIPGPNQNTYSVRVLERDLAPDDTAMISLTRTTNIYANNQSFNVNLTVTSLLFMRSGSDQVVTEATGTLTNNALTQPTAWLVPQGWGVNVATVDAQNMFSIYPNPSSSGVFTINSMITNAADAENKINVMDINGRVVFSTNLNSFNNEQTLDLSGLTNGIYFVEYTVGEFKSTQKVSISK